MTSVSGRAIGWRGWVGGSAVFLAGTAGAFKGTVLLSWLPIDATLLSVGFLVVLIGHLLMTRGLSERLPWQVVVLFAVFVPGVVQGLGSPGSAYKSAYLFTVTLVVVLGGTVVLGAARRRAGFLYAHVLGAFAMAASLVVAPNVTYVSEFGREAVEGSSTIGTSRVICAGAVVLALVSLTAVGARVRLASVFGAGILAFSAIQVGSRGPVLAMALAIAVVALTTKSLKGRRLLAYIGITAVGLIGISLLLQSSGAGARRVAGAVNGDGIDQARSFIYTEAAQLIGRNPLGTGWGTFSEASSGAVVADHPHNLFLEVFLEGGWIAGACLIAYCLAGLVKLRRCDSGIADTCYYGLAVFWLGASLFSSDINGNRLALALAATGFVLSAQAKGSDDGVEGRLPNQHRPHGAPARLARERGSA